MQALAQPDLVAQHRRDLGLDPHRAGVDLIDHAAILAEETVAQPLEQGVLRGVVRAGAGKCRSRSPGAARSERPVAMPVGGVPTALRNRVKRMVCFSSVSRWRTVQTIHLPECRAPIPTRLTSMPARSTTPSRSTSASPSHLATSRPRADACAR